MRSGGNGDDHGSTKHMVPRLTSLLASDGLRELLCSHWLHPGWVCCVNGAWGAMLFCLIGALRFEPAGLALHLMNRPGHTQIFLEPEGRDTPELYVQGLSTGLPERLQLALLRTLPGAPRCFTICKTSMQRMPFSHSSVCSSTFMCESAWTSQA